MTGEKPAVIVTLRQDGLRGRTARIHQPDRDLIIDDNLLPAELTDGSAVHHGQYVVIADDEPNVFGALTVHAPGNPDNKVVLKHYLLAVAIDEPRRWPLVTNAAEFHCLYQYLGFTRECVARLLNVDADAVLRWESGAEPVPNFAAMELSGIANETSKHVRKLAADLRGGGTITTYQSDGQFRDADPFGLAYPASWHRAVAARVAEQATDVHIDYHHT